MALTRSVNSDFDLTKVQAEVIIDLYSCRISDNYRKTYWAQAFRRKF